jgi:hypothetical protein
MGNKLNWKHDYGDGPDQWTAGKWTISILACGMFNAAKGGERGKEFETLRQAQAWCEAQEPEAPLPKAGEVWGKPEEPGTCRRIIQESSPGVHFVIFAIHANFQYEATAGKWQSWRASSGAVRLDTMPGRLAEAEGLLRRWEREPSSMPLLEQTRAFLEGEGDAR